MIIVKSLKKDAFGITTLRENEILKSDTLDKADICNKQFQSVFMRESDSEIPCKGTSPFTPMGEITVDPKGVFKLLNGHLSCNTLYLLSHHRCFFIVVKRDLFVYRDDSMTS